MQVIVAPGSTRLLDRIAIARRSFDPVGHYARPDVLTLTDNTKGESPRTLT